MTLDGIVKVGPSFVGSPTLRYRSICLSEVQAEQDQN